MDMLRGNLVHELHRAAIQLKKKWTQGNLSENKNCMEGFWRARATVTSRDLADLKVLLKIYGGMFGLGPRRTAWAAEQHHSGTPNKPCTIFHPIFYQ